jgi:hypothetical protein
VGIRPVGLVRVGFRRAGSASPSGLPFASPLVPNAVVRIDPTGAQATTGADLLWMEADQALAVLTDATAYVPVTDSAGLVVKKNSGRLSVLLDAGGFAPNTVLLRNGGGGTRDTVISTNLNGLGISGGTAAASASGLTLDGGGLGNAQITATTDHFVVSTSGGPLLDINGTNNLQFQVDGSAANPAVGFIGSAGLGIYRAGAGILGIAAGAAEVARATTQGLGLINGAVGTPSLFFTASPTTGLYRSAANVVGIAANGTAALTIAQNQATFRPGSVGTPAIVLSGGTTTGLYQVAATDIGFSSGGVKQGGFNANGCYFVNKVSFFGVAAVGQRAKTGTAPAGALYTANEQAMLNDAFNTLIGLGVLA